MGASINILCQTRVKPSFVILTSGHSGAQGWASGHSGAQGWASECPDVKNHKWRLNLVRHRMLYSRTHVAATMGVKGLVIASVCWCRSWLVKTGTKWCTTPFDRKVALEAAECFTRSTSSFSSCSEIVSLHLYLLHTCIDFHSTGVAHRHVTDGDVTIYC